jgi:hypothetical protein
MGRDRMQAEQLARRPAERVGLRAPSGKEAFAVLDGLLPTVGFNQLRAVRSQRGEYIAVGLSHVCPKRCPMIFIVSHRSKP